jgi:hypothetical protein
MDHHFVVIVDVFFCAQWLEPEMLGLGGVGGRHGLRVECL